MQDYGKMDACSSQIQARALGIPLIVAQVFQFIQDDSENDRRIYGYYGDWERGPSRKHTLAQCALVSPLWNEEASKILYRRITICMYIEDDHPSRSWSLDSINPFLKISPSRWPFIVDKVRIIEFRVLPTSMSALGPEFPHIVPQLQFPRLERIVIENLRGRYGELPLWHSCLKLSTFQESQLAAFYTLLSSPNLSCLDLMDPYSMMYALQPEIADSEMLVTSLSRLTTLCLTATSASRPEHLRLIQHCQRLKYLTLFYTEVPLTKDNAFGRILAHVFNNLPSLEVLKTFCHGKFARKSRREPQTIQTRSRLQLRKMEFEGTVDLVDQVLERLDSERIEILDLSTRAEGTDATDLNYFTHNLFPKLRHLSILRSSVYDGPYWEPEDRPLEPWTLPSSILLSVSCNIPSLTYIGIKSVDPDGFLRIDIDDDFFFALGTSLPNLEHLEIKNDPNYACSWTSTGFIDLCRSCRRLTYFDVGGGRLDITEPAFQNALRVSYVNVYSEEPLVNDTDTVLISEPGISPDHSSFPLCPYLRTLFITGEPPEKMLADKYPDEMYPRAPPAILTRLNHLLRTHFPSLMAVIRPLSGFQPNGKKGGKLDAELRRKRTTGNWPLNRLSHFASPWYARTSTGAMAWKFEANEFCLHSGSEGGSMHESDSNSDICSERIKMMKFDEI